MGSSSEYSSHLSAAAVATVLSLPKRKQLKVLAVAERIAQHPFKISDDQTKDAAGHLIENILVDEFHYSYWVDHAMKEVRVTEIVRV